MKDSKAIHKLDLSPHAYTVMHDTAHLKSNLQKIWPETQEIDIFPVFQYNKENIVQR